MARRPVRRPVIGLTLDREEGGGYSRYPWYAIRENYCTAVTQAGGLPVLLPHDDAAAESYLESVAALIVTGGHFDVDPHLFGAEESHPSVRLKAKRTAFELAATRAALERDLPLLGICGGQQLLNVALGGSLIQHIPDEVPDSLAHEQLNPRHEAGHDVALVPGTLLHRICAVERLEVNSAHHQAVKTVGPGVVINARAPDGVIEGIEAPERRFCLGVQWHPEFALSAADEALFAALVAAAGGAA
jgi:putative glutamine amidotransferase